MAEGRQFAGVPREFIRILTKKSMMKFPLFLVVYQQSPKKIFVGTYKVLDEIHTFSCS